MPPRNKIPPRLSLALSIALAAGVACSSGGSGGGTGGASGGGGAGPLTYAPCSLETRVGGIAVDLRPTLNGAPPFTYVGGSMRDGVVPSDKWVEKTAAGDCHLLVGPSLNCLPTCSGELVCEGNNRCIPALTVQSAGRITITGLGSPAVVMPNMNKYDLSLTEIPYPPFAPGAPVQMAASGETIPAFTLAGQGISPLEVPPASPIGTIDLRSGSPYTVMWTPPAQVGAARIHIEMEIAHHGGIAARIECEVPDTGSTTIPASLVTALMNEGLAGFPKVEITRRTITSLTNQMECMDFAVKSTVERELQVEGVVSCNSDDRPCPDNRTCRLDLSCAPL